MRNIKQFLKKIQDIDSKQLTNEKKLTFMLSVDNEILPAWMGKGLYSSFQESKSCIHLRRRLSHDNLILPDENTVDRQTLQNRRAQVVGTWNLMIEYLQEEKNWNKPLHTVIYEELTKYILNNPDFYKLRYEMGSVSNIGLHRFNIFARRATVFSKKTHIHTFTDEMYLVAGRVISFPFFSVNGLINLVTRKPIDIREQKAFFDKFADINQIYSQNAASMSTLIDAIVKNYTDYNSKLFISSNSDSSADLLAKLKSDDDVLSEKWPAIWQYVLERDSHNEDCLKNNGKALFIIIRDVVMKHDLPQNIPVNTA